MPEQTGTTIRDAIAARIGRQTLANGWPFSYMSRARTLGCAEVCGFWPPTTSKDGAARRAVEGEHEPVYMQAKVVGHKTRKSDRLLRFTIRSLWQRCDRLGGESRLGESEAQSEKSWRNALHGKLYIEALGGISPGHGRLEGMQTDAPPTSRAVLHRPGLYAMKPAVASSLVFGPNSDAS